MFLVVICFGFVSVFESFDTFSGIFNSLLSN